MEILSKERVERRGGVPPEPPPVLVCAGLCSLARTHPAPEGGRGAGKAALIYEQHDPRRIDGGCHPSRGTSRFDEETPQVEPGMYVACRLPNPNCLADEATTSAAYSPAFSLSIRCFRIRAGLPNVRRLVPSS
jgi:hypothetical protein